MCALCVCFVCVPCMRALYVCWPRVTAPPGSAIYKALEAACLLDNERNERLTEDEEKASGILRPTLTVAKETCHMAKETYHMAKETYYMAKETCHMAKET